MTDTLRIYLRYVEVSLRSQMQYRASFALATTSIFLVTILEFLGIWVLFERFGNLRGWTLPEVAFLYGIISVAFAISEAWFRGFDEFPRIIRRGEFDRILLRPRSTVLQVLGSEFLLARVGRLLQGMFILIYGASAIGVSWTLAKFALLVSAVAGGACFFSGLFVLGAVICFWTVESLEVINSLTYGGVETGQFPISIYRPWFRSFFVFVVPLAAVNYLPAHAILDRPDPLGFPTAVYWLAPLAGPAFLWVCLQVWKLGVRHYTSTGS